MVVLPACSCMCGHMHVYDHMYVCALHIMFEIVVLIVVCEFASGSLSLPFQFVNVCITVYTDIVILLSVIYICLVCSHYTYMTIELQSHEI